MIFGWFSGQPVAKAVTKSADVDRVVIARRPSENFAVPLPLQKVLYYRRKPRLRSVIGDFLNDYADATERMKHYFPD
jgi:hypothetical protein